MSYYERLQAQYSFTSIVPAILAGKCMTNEDSAIWDRLMYKNPKGNLAGCGAQAVRIMDQGRVLDPFKP